MLFYLGCWAATLIAAIFGQRWSTTAACIAATIVVIGEAWSVSSVFYTGVGLTLLTAIWCFIDLERVEHR